MAKTILIAIVAGVVSALLAATIAAGTRLGVALFYLTPLPLMIVALGWHPLVGLLGGVLACAALSIVLNGSIALVFAATIVLPAWALSWLILYSRRDETGPQPARWSNPGVVLVAISLYAATIILVGALFIDANLAQFRQALARVGEQVVRQLFELGDEAALVGPNGVDLSPHVRMLSTLLPIVMATALTGIFVLNSWLAALVVFKSGRLKRPWPELPGMALPRGTAALLALSYLATLLPGYPGFAGELVVSTLLLAFTLLGLSVLHAITRGATLRGPILGLVWVTTLLGPAGLLVAGVGVIEQIFGVRARLARRRPPPTPPRQT